MYYVKDAKFPTMASKWCDYCDAVQDMLDKRRRNPDRRHWVEDDAGKLMYEYFPKEHND